MNSTANILNTTAYELTCSSTLNYTALKIGGTIAWCLIFVFSLVGNSFIALIVYKTQSLRRPINYFIANMAISDLLYSMFVFPMSITEAFWGSWPISGPLGQTLCKLTSFLPNVSTAVSIQSLVLIAVDRFGAVVFPLRSPFISPKLCRFFIFATWILAVAVVSPYLFAVRLFEYEEILLCQAHWKDAFGESFSIEYFIVSLHVTFYYIPITLLITLYPIIFIKLKTQVHPGEQLVNAEEQRARRNRNVLKMSLAIVIGFVLCFLPWSVINLLVVFAWDSKLPYCYIELYGIIFLFMVDLNCAINPCICFIFSKNYRQGLKRLLKCFE